LDDQRVFKNYVVAEMTADQIKADVDARRKEMSHEILDPSKGECLRVFFAGFVFLSCTFSCANHFWTVLPAGYEGRTTKFVRLSLSVDMFFLDAGSLFNFYQEWLQVMSTGPEDLAPPPSLTFRDFVLYCEQTTKTPSYRRALQYWEKRIEGKRLSPGPEVFSTHFLKQ
jgi:hypothetical protein